MHSVTHKKQIEQIFWGNRKIFYEIKKPANADFDMLVNVNKPHELVKIKKFDLTQNANLIAKPIAPTF